MVVEWPTKSVDEVKAPRMGAIAIGPFGSRMKSENYVASGVPVIRGTNIGDTREFIGDMVYITDEFADELGNAVVRAGDLVFPHRGSIGQVGIVPQDGNDRYVLSTSLMKLTCDPKQVDPVFLFYFFRSNEGRHELLKNASTVGTPGIGQPLSSLRSIRFPLPPLPEQKAIARILGTLDDKIELNRRMNATLEAMARALFQSWFQDFEPVRRNAARAQNQPSTRPAGHPSPTGRRDGDDGSVEDLDRLFPAAFQDSALGEIPEGWTDGTLGDVATNPRRSVSPNEIAPNTPYIALEHMPRRSIALGDWEPSAEVESGKTAFQKGEILFGKLRPYFHKVGVAPISGVCSTDILVLAPSKPECFGFLLGHAGSDAAVQFADKHSTGTKMPRTNWTDLSSFKIAIPPQSIAKAFNDQIQPLVAQITANLHQSRTLATLRDTLLPKLLSGALPVGAATTTVGASA